MIQYLRIIKEKLVEYQTFRKHDSIIGHQFDNLLVRNTEAAFANAINKGMINPENYMYMYSTVFRDYFKHIDYRNFKSFFTMNCGLMIMKHYRTN